MTQQLAAAGLQSFFPPRKLASANRRAKVVRVLLHRLAFRWRCARVETQLASFRWWSRRLLHAFGAYASKQAAHAPASWKLQARRAHREDRQRRMQLAIRLAPFRRRARARSRQLNTVHARACSRMHRALRTKLQPRSGVLPRIAPATAARKRGPWRLMVTPRFAHRKLLRRRAIEKR